MKIAGLKISDKALLDQKERELDNKLREYVGNLKHELLMHNGFKFNLKKAEYINKKLILRYSPELVKELGFHQLVQAIRKRKRLLEVRKCH